MRDRPHGRELALTDLVHDLAGLLLAEEVFGPALQLRQRLQRLDRRARVEHQRLEAGEERVAPHRRHEPRHAGHDQAPVARARQQHAHVALGAAQHRGELLVVAEDVARLGEPALVVAADLAQLRVEVGLGRRLRHARRLHLDGEPDHLALARLEAHVERDVGALDARRRRGERDHGLAQHVVEPQVSQDDARGRRLGRQTRAAAAPPRAAHLEHVGEVRAHGYLDRHLDRLGVEVLDSAGARRDGRRRAACGARAPSPAGWSCRRHP